MSKSFNFAQWSPIDRWLIESWSDQGGNDGFVTYWKNKADIKKSFTMKKSLVTKKVFVNNFVVGDENNELYQNC